MKRSKFSALMLAGALSVAAAGLSACEQKKGPVEKAGEKIDEAVEKAKDAVDPKGPAEKAGEKVDEALGH